MQFEKLRSISGVSIQKMCDTGAWFKRTFKNGTPPTAVVATESWDKGLDAQSVYYDSKNYVANVFRYGKRILIRALFLFDERVTDKYIVEKCDTFDAVYENLPIVDSFTWTPEEKEKCGMVLDTDASPFTVRKICDGALAIEWDAQSVLLYEDRIELASPEAVLYIGNFADSVNIVDTGLEYQYKGYRYDLVIDGAHVTRRDDTIVINGTGDRIILRPQKTK